MPSAIAPDDTITTSMPRRAQLDDLIRDRRGPARGRLGEQPAADLDDDALARCDERCSRSRSLLDDHRRAMRARHRRSSDSIAPSRNGLTSARQLDLDGGDGAREEAVLVGERGLHRLLEVVDVLGLVDLALASRAACAARPPGREVGELERRAHRRARGRERAAAERMERERAGRAVDRADDLLAQRERGRAVEREPACGASRSSDRTASSR